MTTSELGEIGYTVIHTKPDQKADFGMLTFYQRKVDADKAGNWKVGMSYSKNLDQPGLTANAAPPMFQVMYRIRTTSIGEDTSYKRDYIHKFTSLQKKVSANNKNKNYTVAKPEAVDLDVDEKMIYRRLYLEFSWPASQE